MTLQVPQEFDRVNEGVLIADQIDPSDLNTKVQRLASQLMQGWATLRWYDAYYEGEQAISYMSAAMAADVQGLIRAVVLNWCRLGADMYASRLRIDGFRYKGGAQVDQSLMETWQANGLDALFNQAVLESQILGRSCLIGGTADTPGGEPIVTVESPFQVTWTRDPRTRKLTEAFKAWWNTKGEAFGTLYEPDRTIPVAYRDGRWVINGPVDAHNLGTVPVVPLVNRPRILRPNGLSEFHDVIPLVDAAIKAATDMMISAEYHAMPRRWVFGMKKGDFKDQNGNNVSAWSRIAGRLWSHENENIKVGQFPEADLRNFHDTIKLLARMVAQILAAPEALAFDSVNPPSAEAFGAMHSERSMRIRTKQVDLGENAEDTMRLVLRLKTGQWDSEALALETIWKDPDTMTFAQKADGIVKLVTAKDGQGRSILTVEQAREDLGYDAIARQRMEEQDKAAQSRALDALRQMAQDQQQPQLTPADVNQQPGG